MKKIHRKVIGLQARKFDKLLPWVMNVDYPAYTRRYVDNYNKAVFPNGVNPNSVSRNSKWLKPSVKAKIVRKDIHSWGELWAPHCYFKDRIFFEITGIDAQQCRDRYDIKLNAD